MTTSVPVTARRAVWAMVLANLCFAVMAALIRGSVEWEQMNNPSAQPPGTFEAVFWRSAVMLLWCAILLWRRANLGQTLADARPHFTWLAARGGFGALAMACFFYGSLHIPLATASLFSNSSVFFIIVLALVFLGERAGKMRLVYAAGGFLGVLLVLGDGIGNRLDGETGPWPVIIAFASAPLTAVAYFSVRKMKQVRSELIILSLAAAGTVIAGAGLLAQGVHLPQTALGTLLLMIAALPGCIGQFFMTASFRGAQASLVASAQYTGPVFSAVLGTTFFGDRLTMTESAGVMLVIAFGVLLPMTEAKKQDNAGPTAHAA